MLPNGSTVEAMEATQTSGSEAARAVSGRIKALAAEKGKTLTSVQTESGVTERTFARKLNHRPDLWTVAELAGIAAALGITYTDLAA